MASVPSAKTNNLLMERSGTEEEELTRWSGILGWGEG